VETRVAIEPRGAPGDAYGAATCEAQAPRIVSRAAADPAAAGSMCQPSAHVADRRAGTRNRRFAPDDDWTITRVVHGGSNLARAFVTQRGAIARPIGRRTSTFLRFFGGTVDATTPLNAEEPQ